MPKKLRLHDNLRIDRPDFERAANEFTEEYSQQLYKNLVGKNYPGVLRGFDVSVVGNQVTVHHGFGYDRTGRVLTEEDSLSPVGSVVLGSPNQTYYIEIEYTETDSDEDYRAFWDPSVTNTPPLPNGSETALTVATRVTPRCQIVQPVSTVGFDITSNPASTKVPVAVLSTDAAGNITPAVNNFSALLVPHTNLRADVVAGATSLPCFDSKNIFAGDTLTIYDPLNQSVNESVVVVGNNPATGVVTVVATGSGWPAGSQVRVTSAAGSFVPKTTDPNSPEDTFIPGVFQGDEIRGSGLLYSAQTLEGRDDLKVGSLKDYVDFLSAQIREMKFGNPRSGTTATTPLTPPGSGARYYDNAGSIAGAKGFTFSIGDGINSFGDFNGTDEQPFIDAIAALPAQGGRIFVKTGTYTGTGGVVTLPVLPKVVEFVGNQCTLASIHFEGGTASGTSQVSFTDMTFTDYRVRAVALGGIAVALDRVTASMSDGWSHANSSFVSVFAVESDLTNYAVRHAAGGAQPSRVHMVRCGLTHGNVPGSLANRSIFGVDLHQCTVTITSKTDSFIILGSGPVRIKDCTITSDDSSYVLLNSMSATDSVTIVDTDISVVAPTDLSVSNGYVRLYGQTNTVTNSRFAFNVGNFNSAAIGMIACQGSTQVTGCTFAVTGNTESTRPIYLPGGVATTIGIENCTFDARHGVVAGGSSTRYISVKDCLFTPSHTGPSVHHCIDIGSTVMGTLDVSNCKFFPKTDITNGSYCVHLAANNATEFSTTVRDCELGANDFPLRFVKTRRKGTFQILNNHVHDVDVSVDTTGHDCFVYDGSDSATICDGDFVVTGNVVLNCKARAGAVRIDADPSNPRTNAGSILVSGNVFRGIEFPGQPTSGNSQVITVTGDLNPKITGNTIENVFSSLTSGAHDLHGIRVWAPNSGTGYTGEVSNNNIATALYLINSSATNYLIRVQGGSGDYVVAYNTLTEGTSSGTGYLIHVNGVHRCTIASNTHSRAAPVTSTVFAQTTTAVVSTNVLPGVHIHVVGYYTGALASQPIWLVSGNTASSTHVVLNSGVINASVTITDNNLRSGAPNTLWVSAGADSGTPVVTVSGNYLRTTDTSGGLTDAVVRVDLPSSKGRALFVGNTVYRPNPGYGLVVSPSSDNAGRGTNNVLGSGIAVSGCTGPTALSDFADFNEV